MVATRELGEMRRVGALGHIAYSDSRLISCVQYDLFLFGPFSRAIPRNIVIVGVETEIGERANDVQHEFLSILQTQNLGADPRPQ